MLVKYRTDFAKVINERNYETAIEIGVAYGGFANYLLSNSNIKKYFLIDPFNSDINGVEEPQSYGHDNVLNRLKEHISKITMIVKFSDDAYTEFKDNSIDFIYIDGDHSYEQVKKDLINYWPKLRKNGIMSGHDYGYYGINEAVDEFVKNNNLTLNLTEAENASEKESGLECGVISFWFEKK